jgi:hypothetical protein
LFIYCKPLSSQLEITLASPLCSFLDPLPEPGSTNAIDIVSNRDIDEAAAITSFGDIVNQRYRFFRKRNIDPLMHDGGTFCRSYFDLIHTVRVYVKL